MHKDFARYEILDTRYDHTGSIVLIFCGDLPSTVAMVAPVKDSEGIQNCPAVTFLFVGMVVVAKMGQFVGKGLEYLPAGEGHRLSFHPFFASGPDYLMGGKRYGPGFPVAGPPDPLFFSRGMLPRPYPKGHSKPRHLLFGPFKVALKPGYGGGYLWFMEYELSHNNNLKLRGEVV